MSCQPSSKEKKHNSDANQYMNQSDFTELVERFESPDREAWQKPHEVIDSKT